MPGVSRVVSGGALLLLVACGGDGRTTAPSQLSVTDVTVTGPSTLAALGERAQLVATARFSDGSTQDQTSASLWTTSDSSVASVSAGGLVTAIGGGRLDIRATFQGVTGVKPMDVALGTPRPDTSTTGRIETPETVADLLTYHQDAVAGSFARRAGIIARWELPVPVYVESSASARNVELALAYWQSVTGLTFTMLGSNTEPRILVRGGTDGVGSTGGRGLVDATYADGRARSGLAVIRTDRAQCEFSQVSCAVLYEHELGHAIGLFDHVAGGGIMSGGSRASVREVNMLIQLYRLPPGTHVEPDGTWRAVP